MPVGASHADHARRLSAEALVEYGYSLVILAGPGGGQTLGCKLDECLDQRRNVSAARIHGIKPANRRRVVVENAAQPPVPDRRLGDLVGQLSDAGRWARNDAVMASEVRRRYRDAAAGEVVRAGAQDSMRGGELAGDQC